MSELGTDSSLGFCDLEIIAEAVAAKIDPKIIKPIGRKRFLKLIREEGVDCLWVTLPSRELKKSLDDTYERSLYAQVFRKSGEVDSFVLSEAYSIEPLDKESLT